MYITFFTNVLSHRAHIVIFLCIVIQIMHHVSILPIRLVLLFVE